METQKQGNESNAHIVIRDNDGTTVFNGHRTVRNIENDGISKTGEATISGKTYQLSADGWKWIGNACEYSTKPAERVLQ